MAIDSIMQKEGPLTTIRKIIAKCKLNIFFEVFGTYEELCNCIGERIR
jgi:hypothetical protein